MYLDCAMRMGTFYVVFRYFWNGHWDEYYNTYPGPGLEHVQELMSLFIYFCLQSKVISYLQNL